MTALRELADDCRKPYPEGDHGSRYADGYNDASNDIADRIISLLDAEGDGGAVGEWIDGYPNHVYASEWFIAHTIYNDRVVLRALPEEYSYDFTTADDTYMKKENVKRWMQFPDS